MITSCSLRSVIAALTSLALYWVSPALATEYHVSPSGSDGNIGSSGARFKTISKAAEVAQPGDVITVHAGIYRERINPPRGGTSDAMRITYQAAAGEQVVLKGSEPVSGWQFIGGDTWMVTLPNSRFGGFHPYQDLIRGDWFYNLGRDHHTGAVYLNGHWLTECAAKATVLQAAGSAPQWFAEVDGATRNSLCNVSGFRPLPGPVAGAQLNATGYSSQHGIRKGASAAEGKEILGWIETNDWVRYANVDFGSNANQFQVRAAAGAGGGVIELRLGSRDGTLIGNCVVPDTGGWDAWQTVTATITPTSGVQTLCFVFKPQIVGADNTRIYAQFPGVNPNTSNVEITTRQTVFYPDEIGRNYLTVRGFTLEQAATPWAPPTAEQIGLIGTHWSKGWIIENNTVRYSACSGISLGKYGDEFDNTSADSAEGYVLTINRALASGWNGATIGHHLVRNNDVSNCEQAGIVGSLGAIFCTISDNIVRDIHIRRQFDGFEQAGIKLHGAIDTWVSGNHIHHCIRGIWLDWMAQGTRFTRNLMHDNAEQDLWLEVNHGPFLVDHNLLLSGKSLDDWSEGGAYAHNLFGGSMSRWGGQDRQTPYHSAHSTTLAGITTIQGGDDRFYNNLFVGSTSSLSGYNVSALPTAMNGNVFTNGASASSLETNPLVDGSYNPTVTLTSAADGTYLAMNLNGTWDALRMRPLVTTSLLGTAAVATLPYVQPDNSSYQLNTDYFMMPRNSANPFPGPFEQAAGGSFSWRIFRAENNHAAPTLSGANLVDDRSGAAVLTNRLVTYTLTFSEDMDASTVTAADFSNAGTSPVTIGAITETSPGVFRVAVVPTAAGTLRLSVISGAILADSVGDLLDTSQAIVDDTILVVQAADTTSPTLLPNGIVDHMGGAAVAVNAAVVYTVTFSEEMDAASVTAADFSNAGTAVVVINSVTQSSPGVFAVQVTPTTVGSLRLQVPSGAVLTDVAGNALNTSNAILDNTTLSIETAPLPPGYLTDLSENFSGNSVGPYFTLGTGLGTPSTTFDGAFKITSGPNNRVYIGTHKTDYSLTDFIFEADVTVPNLTNPWSIPFMGMGKAVAVLANNSYGEPLTIPHVLMAVRNDEDQLEARDNSPDALANSFSVNQVGITEGTHRLRMSWNATSKIATFAIDLGNNGTYDSSFTVDGSDNGFDSTNSQLLLGGGNGVSFDNISVIVKAAVVPLKITSITRTGTTVTVAFLGTAGTTYALNKSLNLNFTVPNIKSTLYLSGTTSGTLQDTSATEPAAFYRVEQQ
jgi:alpha-L-arabinofuranosidase